MFHSVTRSTSLVAAFIACLAFPAAAQVHSADTTGDNAINLSELLRVIQFFNSDGFHCQAGTEDDYAPDPFDTSCAPHASDYNPQDWAVNLSELLRLIQFFNSDGYHTACASEDTYGPGAGPHESCEGEGEGECEVGTFTGEEETIMLPGDVPLTMVRIPAGCFQMGRNQDPLEQDSRSWEDPQHPVTLSSGFWMAKYELTKAQWTAVMWTTPWSGQRNVLDDPDSPAVYVSWTDAQAFITELNGLTGKTFRLPSESEWEYACRAGTSTRFYWGDDPSYSVGDAYAWLRYSARDVNEKYADVVGLKLPNAFGLRDMSGNVWEWCEDDWHWWDYTGAPANGDAWVESPRGSGRVSRGGSWSSLNAYCRSASRGYDNPDATNNIGGFRVARTP